MSLTDLQLELQRQPAPLPIWRATVCAEQWSAVARAVHDQGGRLISLWASDRRPAGQGMVISAAYGMQEGLVWVELGLGDPAESVSDLAVQFPCAGRMQRAMADLQGIRFLGSRDKRPWLDHGLWSEQTGPLPAEYPFVRVEGDGVHEIAVGPVHAGIIEPGHFRFSVVGEKVLRLEQRLGYTHKGIEQRFTTFGPIEARRLAGRISGDSTVAYTWAYCMALESAWGCEVPERASWLRALMLERERVANHLGDLGALGNDAALGFGLAQFSSLREEWLRMSRRVFGHRLMMDVIVPGGCAADLSPDLAAAVIDQCDVVEQEVYLLRSVYNEHAGLQDRFLTTGTVTPQLAAQLGLTGLAGRASAQARDLRRDHPWQPYAKLDVKICTQRNGDVAARVAVRFDEVVESLRLIRALCADMPTGPRYREVVPARAASAGMGWVEGWRGEVLVALELTADALIQRCHCHDPSWQNWPVLEHAVIGNIVPDFPLINKSFNLSYAGHDL